MQDFRFAARQLWKSPGFLLVAVVTLALGIGANTAVFSVINAILLRPLAYLDPGRLTLIWSSVPSQGLPIFSSAPPDYRAWRSENHTFADMGAFSNGGVNLSVEGQPPQELTSSRITASLFRTLGVRPILGNWFTERNEQWGEHRVAILSYGLWQRSFGGDPNIVGRQVHLGGEIYSIVGVMPKDFVFFRRPVVIWTPLAWPPKDNMNTRNNHFLWVVGRLKPGVTEAQASSDLNVIADRIAKQFPENQGLSVRLQDIRDNLVGKVRAGLLALFGAVLFVLLVSCVNLANLLLARAASRHKEFAVRSAIGASRTRLVRQFISESVFLAALGGAAGVLLGTVLLRVFVSLLPATFPRIQSLRMDPYVLAFTAALALGSVLLFGIVPALEASRANPQEALHENARSVASGRRSRKIRSVLVISEMALATALLAGAGLLIKSFSRLLHQDFGFEPRQVLTFAMPMTEAKHPTDELQAAFVGQVLQRLRVLPGVTTVGIVNTLPLGYGMGWGKNVSGESFPPMHSMADVPNVLFNLVSSDYLRAMSARLIAGRHFSDSDTAKTHPVAIVNQTFAQRFYPNQKVVGKTIRLTPPQELIPPQPPEERDQPQAPYRTIVGIIGDLKNGEANEQADAEVFVPYTQFAGEGWGAAPMFAVRSEGDPASLTSAIRNAISDLDTEQPISDIAVMGDRVQKSLAQSRFTALLLGLFSSVAVLLAAIGIYGVISYGVSARSQEIGVRMALGANRSSVLAMVMKESLRLAALGLVVGLVLALGLSRMIASLMFGIRATDPAVYLLISAVVVVVALLAAAIPARRAAALEPMQALRAE